MDTGHHLLEQPLQTGQIHKDFRDNGHVGLAMGILKQISLHSELAKDHLRLLGKMHDFFQGVSNSYCSRLAHKSPGWTGGSLEQYKMLEKELKEFGSLQEKNRSNPLGNAILLIKRGLKSA